MTVITMPTRTGVLPSGFVVGLAQPKSTIVLIGDSITLCGDYSDSATIPTIITRNSCGVFHRANIRLGSTFTSVINKGVGGDTTTQMLARFGTDVIANAPGWVMIWGGTNDIYSGGGSAGQVAASVAMAWSNLKTMISMAQDAGIRVILSTGIPRSNWGTVSTMSHGLMQLNHKIKEYAAANPGIILTDPYVAMLDTSTVATVRNGTPLTANYYADTGPAYVHPNAKGGRIMGDILYTALSGNVPLVDARIDGINDAANGDMDNFFNNGMFLAGATLATSWTSDRAVGSTITGTNAKSTRWDTLPGPVQRVTLTTAPAVGSDLSNTDQWRLYNGIANIAPNGMAAGDSVFFEAELNITETSGNSIAAFLYCICYNAAAGILMKVYGNYPAAGSTGQVVDFTDGYVSKGVIRTPVFKLPSFANGYGVDTASGNCTQLLPMLYMATTAGANIQYDWARVQLRKVQT